MSARRLAGVAALVGGLALMNLVAYRGSVVSADELTVLTRDDETHAPPDGAVALPWAELAATRPGGGGRPEFTPAVVALQGKEVEVSGYAFLLKTGVNQGQVVRLVVMPPTLATCCGPTCTPSLEKIVYVDCAQAPLPRELWKQAGLYARFVGTLTLADSASLGCLFTLRGAQARLYEVEGDRARLVFDTRRAAQPARGGP